jgi:hypothetical protein
MPQLQLPIFSSGMTLINANLGFMREKGVKSAVGFRIEKGSRLLLAFLPPAGHVAPSFRLKIRSNLLPGFSPSGITPQRFF